VSALVEDRRVHRVFLAIAASIGWISLALQLDRNLRDAYASGQTALHGFAHFATFFTSTTNTLTVVMLTLALMGGRYRPSPSVMAAVANYMTLVSVIFILLLDGGRHRTGIDWIANFGEHYLMPFLVLVNWVVLTPHGALDWRQPFVWLVYPVAYFPYMLARGVFAGDYPYWFINPVRVGWPHLFLAALILLIVFWAVGQIFVWLDGVLARFSKPVDASGPSA
jgi:hypothetical protein